MMFQLQMFFNCTWHDNLATNRQQLQLLLLISYGILTAVPSENYCMSLGPYEWPVLVALKCMLLVYLNICFLLLQEWFRESHSKLMAVQLVNYSYSPQLGCAVELILAVYKIIRTHSFVLKLLLQ